MRRAAPSVPQRQFVTFRLGRSEFGLDVFAVQEVLRDTGVTAVPRAPEFVEGVVDVRGALVPVIDMRRRLETSAAAEASDARILLVRSGGEQVGLVVDQVTEVLRTPEPTVLPPPAYLQQRAADTLQAIVRLEDRMILVLDVERLLSSDERIRLRELEAAIAEMREAERAEAEADAQESDAAGDAALADGTGSADAAERRG